MEFETTFDRLLTTTFADLPNLLVLEQQPVTWLFLEVPDGDDASKPGSIQQQAVEQMEGVMAHGLDRAVLARFSNPAAAIGAWITLGSWTSPDLRGGASYGYGHRADLVRLCTAEAAALANIAGPSELWISFEMTTIVDLNDSRFKVESVDRGRLVPASCKLTLRL